MKKTALLLLIGLQFLFSCLSGGETQEKETYSREEPLISEPPAVEAVESKTENFETDQEPEQEQEQEKEVSITVYASSPAPAYEPLVPPDLPLPEYRIRFYSYIPLGEKTLPPKVDLALPLYRQPTPSVKTTAVPVKPVVEKAREIESPPEAPQEELQEEELREEKYSLGIPIPLVLEGTDWVYMGEENQKDPGFKDRQVLTDRTLFTFNFPEVLTYVLLFQRQDNRTGDSEQKKIRVIIEKEPTVKMDPDPTPVDSISPGGEDLVEAEALLEVIEENPARAEESLDLLEFLVNGEANDGDRDNETLAGYYYRMARLLEMNSKVQDLKKAYDTYIFITEQFFLTEYYELSEERIRFLDRHFFKLR